MIDIFLIIFYAFILIICFKFLEKLYKGGTNDEHSDNLLLLARMGVGQKQCFFNIDGDNNCLFINECNVDTCQYRNGSPAR